MAIGSGLASQWTSPVAEVTYGVAPSLATAKFTALDSDTLELKKTTKESEGIFAGKLYARGGRRVVMQYSAGGGAVMDLPARGLQQWLFPMFGSYGQTASALTQDGATGAYSAIHTGGDLGGHTFAMQKGVPSVDGTVKPFTYTGCKISEWELQAAINDIVKLTLTIEARNELAGAASIDPLNGSVPTLQAYTAPATPGGVFTFLQGALYVGGTVSTTSGVTSVSSPVKAGNVLAASVKHTVPLDVDRYAAGLQGFRNEPIQNGVRQVTGSYDIEWLAAATAYNAFVTDTPTCLELTFVGPSIGSGSDFSTFTLLLPQTYYDGESPKIPGPQVVKQTVPFTTLDDDADNVIQATYWTLDAS